jgi:hypothetical protein
MATRLTAPMLLRRWRNASTSALTADQSVGPIERLEIVLRRLAARLLLLPPPLRCRRSDGFPAPCSAAPGAGAELALPRSSSSSSSRSSGLNPSGSSSERQSWLLPVDRRDVGLEFAQDLLGEELGALAVLGQLHLVRCSSWSCADLGFVAHGVLRRFESADPALEFCEFRAALSPPAPEPRQTSRRAGPPGRVVPRRSAPVRWSARSRLSISVCRCTSNSLNCWRRRSISPRPRSMTSTFCRRSASSRRACASVSRFTSRSVRTSTMRISRPLNLFALRRRGGVGLGEAGLRLFPTRVRLVARLLQRAASSFSIRPADCAMSSSVALGVALLGLGGRERLRGREHIRPPLFQRLLGFGQPGREGIDHRFLIVVLPSDRRRAPGRFRADRSRAARCCAPPACCCGARRKSGRAGRRDRPCASPRRGKEIPGWPSRTPGTPPIVGDVRLAQHAEGRDARFRAHRPHCTAGTRPGGNSNSPSVRSPISVTRNTAEPICSFSSWARMRCAVPRSPR